MQNVAAGDAAGSSEVWHRMHAGVGVAAESSSSILEAPFHRLLLLS